MLRLFQIPQSVFAQVAQAHWLYVRILEKRGRGRRKRDLPAVERTEDTCRPAESQAEVVAVAHFDHAAVQGHARPQLWRRLGLRFTEAPLRLPCGADRVGCVHKGDAKTVARGLKNMPATGGKC